MFGGLLLIDPCNFSATKLCLNIETKIIACESKAPSFKKNLFWIELSL